MALRWCWLAVAALLSASLSLPAQALTYDEAQALARERAPALQAARARIQAARQSLTPADALPDPTLALGIDNLAVTGDDAFGFDGDRMTMQRIAISQEFPNRAKRRARLQTAEAMLAETALEQEILQLDVARQLADAWLRRQASEAQLTLLDEMLRDNRLLTEAVTARVRAGELRAVDTVAPRQEAAQLANRRDQWQAERASAIAEMRRWIGDAAEQPISGSAPYAELDQKHILTHLEHHPELRHAAQRVEVFGAKVREAEAEKRPDWGISAGFMKRDEYSDMAMLELRMDLPLFGASRQGPRIAAARAEQQAVSADRLALLQQHEAMLRRDLAEYQRLQQAMQRQQQQLLPLAQEKMTLLQAAWQGAEASLAELMSARLEWLDARAELINLQRDWRRQAALIYYRHAPTQPPGSDANQDSAPQDSAQREPTQRQSIQQGSTQQGSTQQGSTQQGSTQQGSAKQVSAQQDNAS